MKTKDIKQNKTKIIKYKQENTLQQMQFDSWLESFVLVGHLHFQIVYIKYIHLSVRTIPYLINPAACVVGVELFLWCHLLNSIVHEYSLTGQAILKAVQYHSCTISIFSFHLSFLLHSRWVGWNNLNNTLPFSSQTLQDKLMKP